MGTAEKRSEEEQRRGRAREREREGERREGENAREGPASPLPPSSPRETIGGQGPPQLPGMTINCMPRLCDEISKNC